MLRTVIIEDHPHAIELLKLRIEKIPELELLGCATTVPEALQLIGQTQPDLVFLDVTLRQGDGFDLLQRLDRKAYPFHLVFTTGDPNHAIDAIRHQADDYLVKPIDLDELRLAVVRILAGRYYLTKSKRYLRLEDIACIRSHGNDVEFYLVNKGTPVTERNSLQTVLDELPLTNFMRVHRSYIINRQHIREVNRSFLLLSGMKSIPIGASYQAEVLGMLEK